MHKIFLALRRRLTTIDRDACDGSARLKLVMQCKMQPHLNRDIAADSDEIVLEDEDWVKALVNYSHAVSTDGGRTCAFRALDMHSGSLFWLVRKEGKSRGYHSDKPSPLAAIAQAETAWLERKRIRTNWQSVEELARDLLLGRKRLRVRLEDAYESPLCTMGIKAFMRRMRLSGVTQISGRTASILMWIDPQVGFVIHQANLRAHQTMSNSAASASPGRT